MAQTKRPYPILVIIPPLLSLIARCRPSALKATLVMPPKMAVKTHSRNVVCRTSPFKVSVFRYYFWDRILAVETWGRLEERVRFSALIVFFGARGWDAKTTKLTRAAKSRSMLVNSIRFIFAKTFHSFGGIAIIMPR